MTKRTRREELLHMFDQRSSENRCAIIKGLKEEGRELTSDMDSVIKDYQIKATTQRDEIQKIHDELRLLEKAERDMSNRKVVVLKEHKLYSFRNETCGTDTMHPDLIAFDDEVRKERQDLLMMKLPR